MVTIEQGRVSSCRLNDNRPPGPYQWTVTIVPDHGSTFWIYSATEIAHGAHVELVVVDA